MTELAVTSTTFSQGLLEQFKHDLGLVSDWKQCLAMLNKYKRIKLCISDLIQTAKDSEKQGVKISKKKWAFIPRSDFSDETFENVDQMIESLNQQMADAMSAYPESITQCQLCFCFHGVNAVKAHNKSIDHVLKERDFFKQKYEETL